MSTNRMDEPQSSQTSKQPTQERFVSYPEQLKQKEQQAAATRSEQVHNSFYLHFIYEMINMIIKKHVSRRSAEDSASSGRNDDALKFEVEQLGAELGKRVSDQLAIESASEQVKEKNNIQIDKTRFLCCQVWTYLFNHRVTTLKSNGNGAYQINDDSNEFLARLSSENPDSPEFLQKVSVYKAFLMGIIKGVLYNLGAEGPIRCELNLISVDSSSYPKLLILLNYMEKKKPKAD